MSPDHWLSIFKYVLYVGTALIAIGTIGVSIYSDRVDSIKDKKIDELLEKSKELKVGNADLLDKIQAYQADLTAKNDEIDKLKAAAARAGRGEYSRWDFNGDRREAYAGRFMVERGDESNIFSALIELEKDGNHDEIVRLSTAQIAKTPDWLTPYFFRGVAQANLGNTTEGIEDLEYVVERSQDDPAYSRASDFLRELRSRQSH